MPFSTPSFQISIPPVDNYTFWRRATTALRGFQGDSPPDELVFDGAWYDIGSFESYDQANEDYKGRVQHIKRWQELSF